MLTLIFLVKVEHREFIVTRCFKGVKLTSYISLEETKIIDRFSNGKKRCRTYCMLGRPKQTWKLVQY